MGTSGEMIFYSTSTPARVHMDASDPFSSYLGILDILSKPVFL